MMQKSDIMIYSVFVGMSMFEEFQQLSPARQDEILLDLDVDTLQQMARGEWWWTARPEQIPPDGSWSVFLFLAGRGAGKTRSGSEWLVKRTLEKPYDSSGHPAERLVVADNISDTRSICIEGPSGILRVLHRLGYEEVSGNKVITDASNKYRYVKSPKPQILLHGTGASIYFTGADADAVRGFNLADVWMDEPAKWDDSRKVWREGIFPALRANIPGDKPRAFVTGTPKPVPQLQEWLRDTTGRVEVVRGSTFDNSRNLSDDFLHEIKSMYEGTALGRQELYGEMLDSMEGALFSFSSIESNRVDIGPERVAHRCVAVDPGLTGAEDGDEMGVVVACRDSQDHIFIIADETTKAAGRDAAIYAWKIFERYHADTLVYESNLGKAWMHEVLNAAYEELKRDGMFPQDSTAPLVPVFSTQGKKLRAEPVAVRYSEGRVHHIGRFDLLEQQMVGFDPLKSQASPDRLDALVHACRHLIDGERRRSKVISPTRRLIPELDTRTQW